MKIYPVLLFFILAVVSFRSSAEYIERYTVIAERPYYNNTLESIFPQNSYDTTELIVPFSANDILVQSPAVNLNGQGGLIQNINIRGFSRWRIQSLLDGVPVISDRRAGTSLGFLPPALIDTVSVIPGAISTYLGSGAIGGAVNLQFTEDVQPHIRVGWSSNQHAQDISYVDASKNTDWLISHRDAGKGTDANGNTLSDQYKQQAIFIRHRFEGEGLNEAWTLYSDNNDVGKSSSDYPLDRDTIYPDNYHWLGKLAFAFSDKLINVWWHKSRLDTHVLRPGKRINESESTALDYGADIKGDVALSNWLVNWQAQLTGRVGVTINEREFSVVDAVEENDSSASSVLEHTLVPELAYELQTLHAKEINAAGIIDATRSFGKMSVATGGRLDWQRQSGYSESVSSANVSGFVGASYRVTSQWALSLYLSTAFRNPSLTERFFFGETPRGTVIGDVELDTETATNLQGTLTYSGRSASASFEVFHQKINNYIERTTVSEDVVKYTNLDNATMKGASYQITWPAKKSGWDARLSGAWYFGEDNNHHTVADIPAHKQRLDVGITLDSVRLFSVLSYRASKKEIADGERALDDVYTINLGAVWQYSERTVLKASWRNLTNQHYYVTADDKAAFAQGESVQLDLTVLL